MIDWLVNQVTGFTQLNIVAVIEKDDQIITIPYDGIFHIRQNHGGKETIEKVREMNEEQHKIYVESIKNKSRELAEDKSFI